MEFVISNNIRCREQRGKSVFGSKNQILYLQKRNPVLLTKLLTHINSFVSLW